MTNRKWTTWTELKNEVMSPERQERLRARARAKAVITPYSTRDPGFVEAFLQRHPFLLPILEELPNAAKAAFKGSPTLVLQPATYEPWERYDELQVLIQTDQDASDALECLHAFDDNWWLDRYDQTEGKVSVHLEFI